MSQADTLQQVSMTGDFLRATLELREKANLDLGSHCFPPTSPPPQKKGGK